MCAGNDDEQLCKLKIAFSILVRLMISVGVAFVLGVVTSKLVVDERKLSKDILLQKKSEGCLDVAKLILENVTSKDKKRFRRLKKIYCQLHGVNLELRNILHSLEIFAASQEELESAFKLIYHLEMGIHGGSKLSLDSCMKRQLGTTKLAMDMYNIVEPGIFATLVQRISFVQKAKKIFQIENYFTIVAKIQGVCYIRILLYYSDLAKDILVVNSIGENVGDVYEGFAANIQLILIISIVFTEFFNLAYFLTQMNMVLKSWKVKLIFCVLFPCLPAFSFAMMSKYELTRKLTERRFKKQNIEYADIAVVEDLHEKKMLWQKLVAHFKLYETHIESSIQLLVATLAILVGLSSTSTVQGLREVFSSSNDTLILVVLSVLWSVISVVRGLVKFQTFVMDGFPGMVGKAILLTYYLIGTAARLGK